MVYTAWSEPPGALHAAAHRVWPNSLQVDSGRSWARAQLRTASTSAVRRAPFCTRADRDVYSHICEARREAAVDDCREAWAEVVELVACAPTDVGFDVGPLGKTGTELRSGIALASLVSVPLCAGGYSISVRDPAWCWTSSGCNEGQACGEINGHRQLQRHGTGRRCDVPFYMSAGGCFGDKGFCSPWVGITGLACGLCQAGGIVWTCRAVLKSMCSQCRAVARGRPPLVHQQPPRQPADLIPTLRTVIPSKQEDLSTLQA